MDPFDAPTADWHFHDGQRRDVLLICDHASNRIPAELGNLGLDEAQRKRHIAWDPGAAGITLALAQRMRWPAFLGAWSRLVIDLNRAPEAPDLIVSEGDGDPVPGNVGVDERERRRRIQRYHQPYHAAIADYLQRCERDGIRPALIAIHTFTPVLGDQPRPWHAGVVWKRRHAWLAALLEALAAPDLEIGDNRPYDGATAMGYTLDHLGIVNDREHVMFEVRQDLVAQTPSQEEWAGRLLSALQCSGFPGTTVPVGEDRA